MTSHIPAPLAHRDFRLFLGGLTASSFGSQFTSVAAAWQIYQLTNSPLDIGLMALARGLPQMALLLLGGVLADTIDRRRLLVITQLGELSVGAGLVILSWTGLISPLALYVASALFGIFGAIETPARQALIPNLVPREQLTSALALHGVQRNVASIAGPSIAGVLLAFADPGWCYGVNTVSWLLMIAALAAIGVGATSPLPLREREPLLKSLSGGVRFVLSQPVLLGILLLDFGANIFGSSRALLPVFARDILLVGAPGLGLLYAANSAGAMTGAVSISGLGEVRRAGVWVLAGLALYGFCTTIFALSTDYWVSWLMLAGAGAGDTIAAVFRGTIVQLLTPDGLRGRVSSVNGLFSNGGPQLGQFESGLVAQLWSPEVSALTGGLATLALVGIAASQPGLRKFEMDPSLTLPRKGGEDKTPNHGP